MPSSRQGQLPRYILKAALIQHQASGSCCCVGRYQRNSECCEKLAQSLHHLTTVEERGLFDFGSRGQEASPLVLILDRKDDPVTPLLLQWTYQAMVHELIGLDTNRLDLSHIPGVSFPRTIIGQAHHAELKGTG